MIIIGVDPGTLVTGYGVIETDVKTFRAIEFGTIQSKKISSMPKRLEQVFSRLHAVIERTKPAEFAIETAFYDKNAQSAMKLGQARGVALVAAQLAKLEISEYAPRVIKKAVTGNGNASKEQVAKMLMQIFSIKELPRLLDSTDALAVAVCHHYQNGVVKSKSKSWEGFLKDNPGRLKLLN